MILLRQNLFAQTFQYFGFHGLYRLSAVDFDVFRRVFAFQFAVEINQNFGLLVVTARRFSRFLLCRRRVESSLRRLRRLCLRL